MYDLYKAGVVALHLSYFRTCIHNLNNLLLSPLYAPTALTFHANMFNIGMKSRLVSAKIGNKIKPSIL
ncbi:hypothetical protein [Wielerella bovis]|uniref:hypothetical protein n=1 Tax=Wielerella bovis TaxID=2917790 RepID=UPI00201888BA|nr:hypothetical protein [Wielerella bovis]ULJ67351.1 hypothetical protein MIS31_01935 [Wielerella bovis]